MARIAVIDDAKLARHAVLNCLGSSGHELLEVEPTSLASVCDTLQAFRPDIVIMDYLMPLCPGTRLLRSCKNDPVLDQVKYVVLTAHHDVEVTERMQRLGADRILHKPLHKTELLLAVVELLGGTHADG